MYSDQYMLLCQVYCGNNVIKIWVKEDLYVTLVYCGVVEEYAVYSSWKSTLVGLVYFLNSDDRLCFVHWIQRFINIV